MNQKSLTGFWIGLYHYSDESLEPVNFNAIVEESAGMLSGEICENVTFGFPSKNLLFASLNGCRRGSHVEFNKVYADGISEGYVEVIYSGVLHENGNYISGHWDVPGDWSGRFSMQRGQGGIQDISIGQKEHNLLTINR